MRKQWVRGMGFGSLLAVGLTFGLQLSAPAQVMEETIDIVKNKDGDFEFAKKDVTIKKGQSIKWVPIDKGTHKLIPQAPTKEAEFKDTGNFRKTDTTQETKTVKFDKATGKDTAGKDIPINYRCFFHDTMVGKITVQE